MSMASWMMDRCLVPNFVCLLETRSPEERTTDRDACYLYKIVTVAASSRIPYRDKVRRRDDTGLLCSIASRALTS